MSTLFYCHYKKQQTQMKKLKVNSLKIILSYKTKYIYFFNRKFMDKAVQEKKESYTIETFT